MPNPKTSPHCPFEKKFPSSLLRNDEFFMWHAYNLSLDAWKKDEIPVGAVIEHEGHIIASAYNQVESLSDPTAHAEMLAITQAAEALQDWRLTGCTLYVTKEPCPMCAGAIIMARISRCVFAMGDDKQGCLGGALALHNHSGFFNRPVVTRGVLERECLEVFQTYFRHKRTTANSRQEHNTSTME